ncbi:MAG: hypothetical protein Q8N76_06065 [Candidatus Omnitrophota bacterium]|nr:hypothetical protein [Candidatus Omnitrophota bacterium]
MARVFKLCGILILTILVAGPVYSESGTRSIFKDKKVDYKTISDKQEKELRDKEDALRGKSGAVSAVSQSASKQEARVFLKQNSLKDISSIYIPENIGKIVEAYEAPNAKRLVAHIQDLHCNPEAAFNLASILEILVKDYGLNLVCSEGAEGQVDTSSVSGFPDPQTREKVAKLFVNSGELTGEEYLSITKYPKLPIWGIENKDIYFQNIDEFNKIMAFNPDSMALINKVKDALNNLKPKVYSKKILELDKKYAEYEKSEADSSGYIDYLVKLNPQGSGKYKNIGIFTETMKLEKEINQKKIIEESQALLAKLQPAMDPGNKSEIDTLTAKATLFKDKKISPYSFYSYLDELSNKYIKDQLFSYPAFRKYLNYLNRVNSLDSVALFQEIDDLTYDTKDFLSDSVAQKNFIKANRNIKTLGDLFNISVSNEQYNYYLKNKDTCNVIFFKSIITDLSGDSGIDYNPSLIDNHLAELEHFYDIAYKRDVAMSGNALKKIEEANSKVTAIVTGGFHTQGITKALKDSGYSYIVISPYSKTLINEENYRFLLSGKRKPIEDLIQQMNEK